MSISAAQKFYYYHGDRTADGHYYCRRCDCFVDSDHFLSPDGEHNDFEGNHFRLKRDRKVGVPSGYYRPASADSTNLAE